MFIVILVCILLKSMMLNIYLMSVSHIYMTYTFYILAFCQMYAMKIFSPIQKGVLVLVIILLCMYFIEIKSFAKSLVLFLDFNFFYFVFFDIGVKSLKIHLRSTGWRVLPMF